MQDLPIETIILTAITAWALVEWCKPLLRLLGIAGQHKIFALRSIALIVGATSGSLLHPDFYPHSSAEHGFFIGLGCGALNALIVAQIKKKAQAEDNE
jgi:hypothetical protein